ncbi:hypothetical protein ACIBJE_10160 [Micromonospora sp. NPDC050187]|uniref:hypothetical protein n=1 Tax=Micromonospora sp. NPDC050187 TaxID=3364277 RepID=UPI003792A371
MKRRLLRMTQLVGFLLWLASGVGLLLGWPDTATSPLLLAGLLVFHCPTAIADRRRERESKPPKSAEEVLRWYPKWWA